jgi:hypothetical protein
LSAEFAAEREQLPRILGAVVLLLGGLAVVIAHTGPRRPEGLQCR